MEDSREQVTILDLPPNCTSKHQRMDAGIIAAWKVRFKTKLLAKDGNADADISEALKGVGLEPGSDPTQATMDAVEAWCGMEDDDTLKEALVADAREDLLDWWASPHDRGG